MTVTFYSNFLNHHQLPICLEIIDFIGQENFHFVALEQTEMERRVMGYLDMNSQYSFVVRAYENEKVKEYASKLLQDSDVVIMGSTDSSLLKARAETNKLTFLYRERLFKRGVWQILNPLTLAKVLSQYTRYRRKNFYILCASSYAYQDYSICGFPHQKCLKWGYFPKVYDETIHNWKHRKIKFLWCGRMLWWKHPEHAIMVANYLKKSKVDFEMTIIGNGALYDRITKMISDYGLKEYVTVHDFVSPESIREYMMQSDVFLFTSGRQEGWGAVLNEAMNSGCVVIANNHAGSTNYLIQDSWNGFIYNGSLSDLYKKTEQALLCSKDQISKNAFLTIKSVWNPQNAVSSLFKFIISKEYSQGGPCSLA